MLVLFSGQVNGASYNYSTFTVTKYDATMLPFSRGGYFFNTWEESSPVRTFTFKTNGILIPTFPTTVKALYFGQYDAAYVSSFGLIDGVIDHSTTADPYISLFLNSICINKTALLFQHVALHFV